MKDCLAFFLKSTVFGGANAHSGNVYCTESVQLTSNAGVLVLLQAKIYASSRTGHCRNSPLCLIILWRASCYRHKAP